MSPRSEAGVEIAAPPADVFEWLVDPARQERWHGEGAGEWAPADRAALRVGYRATQTLEMARIGRPGATAVEESMVEVIVYEPPLRFGFRQTGPRFSSEVGYLLAPSERGTLLRASSEVTYEGVTVVWAALARLRGVGLEAAQQQAQDQGLGRLRELVENETRGPPGRGQMRRELP